jgi:CxxC motif-containing protein (DUF1111 family)
VTKGGDIVRVLLNTRIFVSIAATVAAIVVVAPVIQSDFEPTPAPTGFVVESNGFAEEYCANQAAYANSPNSPPIPEEECDFEEAADEFTGPETVEEGLGPVFNAAGCGECHLDPILGGASQIVEKRAGFFDGATFFDPPGGSLIQDRAIDTRLIEHVMPAHTNVTALRATISVLGDGFVEAIDDETLRGIQRRQPLEARGRLIIVPVLEAPGQTAPGRFGWKNQHASLVSFSADAYKNEMGITSPLDPVEPTSNGRPIDDYDALPGEPETQDDEGVDVELFALFMRSTLAPPRDVELAATEEAREGSDIFNAIGCNVCHTRRIVTAPPGTLINGGAYTVPDALGNKIIHPFGDFLLHDIGTGDGIVQNGGPGTRNMVRTTPLWGLRARSRFMHDGLSFDLASAILRHQNQARPARDAFRALTARNRQRLLKFLLSL